MGEVLLPGTDRMTVPALSEDPQYGLLVGDVREQLATLPDGSVDCVVTSPPYWGLRDYGVDGQLGLEQSFDEYVSQLVSVFREVRRVLAPHGTCWLNMGDSYAGSWGAQGRADKRTEMDLRDGGVSISRTQIAQHPRRTQTGASWRTGCKPKDMVGQPWAVAFALRADGWYLRSCVIWAKPNPMPESVTDRPTTSHEYVFLLTKQARYFYDAEAVREPTLSLDPGHPSYRPNSAAIARNGRKEFSAKHEMTARSYNPAGRNLRSVWTIPTFPYPEAHFATYPPALVERCLLAGCARRVCRTCGKPRERLIENEYVKSPVHGKGSVMRGRGEPTSVSGWAGESMPRLNKEVHTLGFTDCGHDDYRRGVVLDPFAGSGTTLVVARRLGLDSLGIELNPDYAELARKRLARWWAESSRASTEIADGQLALGPLDG